MIFPGFQKIHRKAPLPDSVINEVAGLQLTALLQISEICQEISVAESRYSEAIFFAVHGNFISQKFKFLAEQRVKSNEQKVTSNEKRAKSFTSFKNGRLVKKRYLTAINVWK